MWEIVGLVTVAGFGFLGILAQRAAVGGQDERGFHPGAHREGASCTCRQADAADASGLGSPGVIGATLPSSAERAGKGQPFG